MEERRDEAPDWLGPLAGLLVLLVLAGLAVLLWLTIFAGSDEAAEEGAARAAPAILRHYAPV
jgi:hypothetical protein